ncbi:hypothetical protein [Pseudomonas asiatica]|uniref:hypothetical protein n=1 Tax=Pseudomonas asiatica TaxID=2219225 RepID=UPI0034582D5C
MLGLIIGYYFNFMNFSWTSIPIGGDVDSQVFDIAFVGEVVDDRGEYCKKIALECSRLVYEVKYDAKSFTLSVGAVSWLAHQVDKIPGVILGANILFDATTLDFPDMLLILRGYLSSSQETRFSFLYAEPASYSSRLNSENNHDFNLADGYANDHYPIPGFINLQRSPDEVANVIAFVGFESHRLRSLIADAEGENPKRYNIVIGIPPFKTAWETHALMQNASVLLNAQIDEILYAGANNPYSCYAVLEMLYNSRALNSSFEIAPLGTKPAGIAAALFAADKRGVSVRYDYPRRSKGRSEGIGKVHVFTAWK